MDNSAETLNWLGPAAVGAILAAVGYVAKLLLEWLEGVFARSRARRASLVALLSLLRAGRVAFLVQAENRDRLEQSIRHRDANLAGSTTGFEQLFTAAYPDMTPDEKELHSIIRSITVNTLHPINQSLLEWVQKDTYFKARTWERGLRAELAKELADLEAHLLLWNAKYTIWIPEDSAHALVYMADEAKHGLPFPKDIQEVVQKLLKKRWWLGA